MRIILVHRLVGREPDEPSIVAYAAEGGRAKQEIGVRFNEDTCAAATALGRLAQKAISSRSENRFASPQEMRVAIELIFPGLSGRDAT